MTGPYGCDPTSDVSQRCEVDNNPPDSSICSQALEKPVVQSQEAVLDRPDYSEEQQDDHKLVANVDISLIDQRLSSRCFPTRSVDEIVQRWRLESLEDRIQAEEEESCQ